MASLDTRREDQRTDEVRRKRTLDNPLLANKTRIYTRRGTLGRVLRRAFGCPCRLAFRLERSWGLSPGRFLLKQLG